jgi:hypothetical protein
MRILITIPHFFAGIQQDAVNRSHRAGARQERLRALITTLATLHQTFGSRVYGLDHLNRKAWQAAPPERTEIDVVIVTTGDTHLLDAIPALQSLYRHHQTAVDPLMLGFECHKQLREARGRYDYYGYVEDDIVLSDPLFFRKRRLFDRHFAPTALLQPNRCELKPDGPVQKLYVDYHIRPDLTAPYQDVRLEPRLELPFLDETIVFERTCYPSSGCFFLNAEQLEQWIAGPHFLDGDVSYMSPLDSAVTLSIMKTFRIYKPVLDQAWFLEVVHVSPRWIGAVTQLVQLESRATVSPALAAQQKG